MVRVNIRRVTFYILRLRPHFFLTVLLQPPSSRLRRNRIIAWLHCHRMCLLWVSWKPSAWRTDHVLAGWFLVCHELLRAGRGCHSPRGPAPVPRRGFSELWAFPSFNSRCELCAEPEHLPHGAPIGNWMGWRLQPVAVGMGLSSGQKNH